MDLQIKNQYFLVCGVSSGFGKETAQHLINEGAYVIGVARGQKKLNELKETWGTSFIPMQGDITEEETVKSVCQAAIKHDISGAFINAGGPPAMQFLETSIQDWDNAYHSLVRWKVQLTKQLVPYFKQKQYGKVVYLESASVKQPIANLVLSTSLRLSVVGMMKTLSQELAGNEITFNMIGPGMHDTPAIDRLIQKSTEQQEIPFDEAKAQFIDQLPSKKMGSPSHLGSLAAWLLSPLSSFVNGQIYAVEGGTVKGTL